MLKTKIKNLVSYMTEPQFRFLENSKWGFYKNMSDEEFLKKRFKIEMGQDLNLEAPQTFNEKLQYLKINNKKKEYTAMVDKYEAKKYVEKKLGEKYIIPTYGVWNSFDKIDFEKLPNQFVLKCTHDSGGVVIVKDKKNLNKAEAKQIINKSLRSDYFQRTREWPYKNVKPRIIAEKYITDSTDTNELTDYKFSCFNGYVDCVMLCLDRSSGDTKFYFFDKDWNLKRINKRGKEASEGFTLPKPECMDEMFVIASKLSEGIPFVRVDLYQSNGKVLFGELTFFPQSGFDSNLLPETDDYFGSLIDLSLVNH